MSSDNTSSVVTYTSISSDSDRPSWGIPLMNMGELSEIDPCEEVAQQRQAPTLSPVNVPNPMELYEHVPPYDDDASLIAESPGHIADSESMEEDSIDYPDEPEDDDKDPEDDHTDYPANEEDDDDKPFDDEDDDDTDDEDEKPTEDEDDDEEEEEHLASVDSSAVPVVDLVPSAEDTKAFETDELEPPMSASIEARIAEKAAAPIPPTSPAYDQAPLGHRVAMIHIRDDIPEEDMPPQRRFVLTAPPPGCDVAESSAVAARPPRAADRAKDVGYVRALQASEHMMMTSIEEVNLRINYQEQVRRQESEDFYTQLYDTRTDRIDIRLEIDVVRCQRTAYEKELHECQSAEDLAVRQIDTVEDTDSSCYRIMHVTRQGANNAITPESIQTMIDRAIQRNSTHTQDDASQSLGGGLRRPVQPARVCSYTDFMKCQPLNFKGTKGIFSLSQWLEKIESVFHISDCAVDNQVKFATCTLLGVALTWWNGHLRTLGHDAAYAMTSGTLKKKLTDKYCPKAEIKKLEIKLWNLKVDKYISGLPNNIHGNFMSARPKTHDDAIKLANDLMDQKLHTYAERQNDNKRKADDSSRTINTNPTRSKMQCAPKCGNCKRYGHTTSDCQVNTNNNNENQKAGACYECGNTEHIKKNCQKLKNRRNGNGNGVAKGRDAIPDSNIITPMFLHNNCYAIILFNTGCTLNFMNHLFNIDLMPVSLGSFNVIIRMDWLTKYHGVIICDEKIVCVPFGRDMLSFQGDGNNQREESRLNIILCTKAQKYLSRGRDIFLAHITTKDAKDKSERKRLEDVPIVKDFPEVFLKDLSSILPARQVEFQIDLVPGVAPVAQFLRHVIDNKGIHVDPAKVKSIKDWASPKNPTKIRQFLGLVGYYRRFIEGFSKILKSMTKLTQTNVKFDWGEKEETAFQLIKQKLCSAPILALPKGSENFIVYCDTLHKGLGAVIMQNEKAQTKALKPRNLTAEDVGGSDKMYQDLKQLYWWPNMKEDIATYKALHKALGTRLDMSTVYHPQTDGQSERTIQTLEDMLHACVLDFGKGWDRHLPLVEFSYNNSYHTSIKAAPFQKGVVRFGKRRKLNPRNVSPFKKCMSDESLVILLEELHVDDKLHCVKKPVEVVDREIKRLKRCRIPIFKVRWNSKRGLEFTWEREDQFKKTYPHLFTKSVPSSSNLS
nr:hypothetical protein [Tanacetum cinerariifolium]